MTILSYLASLLQTGLGSLAAYLAAHVLLCLLPAFFALLLGVLIAGTLQVGLLRESFATITLPGDWAVSFQSWLDRLVPPNPSLGIEGVTVHGVLLIVLLLLIGVTSWLGLNRVDEGYNTWTYVTLGLVTATLVVASFSVEAVTGGLRVGFTGRLVAEIGLIAAVWVVAARFFEAYEIQEWL